MYVIASFEHSVHLELVLDQLEEMGIKKDDIFAIPLKPTIRQSDIFDTIHRSDGISLFDAPAILGVFLAVLGASYGYILKWGPIIWGLIGLVIGFAAGFLLELAFNRNKIFRKNKGNTTTEVVLLIKCYESQADKVEKELYDHFALGTARLDHA